MTSSAGDTADILAVQHYDSGSSSYTAQLFSGNLLLGIAASTADAATLLMKLQKDSVTKFQVWGLSSCMTTAYLHESAHHPTSPLWSFEILAAQVEALSGQVTATNSLTVTTGGATVLNGITVDGKMDVRRVRHLHGQLQ